MSINFVEKIDDKVVVQRVLISVSDKSGLIRFIPELLQVRPDVVIYSTGGTYETIRKILDPERVALNLISVSQYTGQPEMQGGLVKTLDYKIYLGLLSETYNDAHKADLARVGAVVFDMVVVNLYPFRETVARADATPEMARANIDIGGPCMVRAAAKNFLRVAVVTDPTDYSAIIEEMRRLDGATTLRTRFELARKAFKHTAEYDAAIAAYLGGVEFEKVRACYRFGRRT
ncbi:MAG: hypothetical protein N2255_06135 [Kiritimatiellae bacterium]|nr:hypothetical protein [Kiritimatiellia bacterium]